ncbi:MAG: ArsR family transcriptional regulator [Phycisphaeraceae bacterium]|nr:MAG: ArsR family transcriptional regulator [Phycisphaeraceae bacterium]
MPRSATTADVFNAIAEPRRRRIVELLAAEGAQPVGELVLRLKLAQPAVSKHLGVLREVGIVTVTKRGRQRLYELDAKELKPVHDWVKVFERYWTAQLDRVKARAERMASERNASAE